MSTHGHELFDGDGELARQLERYILVPDAGEAWAHVDALRYLVEFLEDDDTLGSVAIGDDFTVFRDDHGSLTHESGGSPVASVPQVLVARLAALAAEPTQEASLPFVGELIGNWYAALIGPEHMAGHLLREHDDDPMVLRSVPLEELVRRHSEEHARRRGDG
jgi:hypothetical protein